MARARVITERDVRRAANGGSRELDASGAIITPSARDAAARSGVTLTGSKLAPLGHDAPRAGARSRPTPSAGEALAQASAPASPPVPAQRIAVGADHGGVALRDAIAVRLRELGHDVTDHGTTGTSPVDYPDYAIAVARAVATGGAQIGIMVDGAGIGSCMTANPGTQQRKRAHARWGAHRHEARARDRRRVPIHEVRRWPARGPRRENRRARHAAGPTLGPDLHVSFHT